MYCVHTFQALSFAQLHCAMHVVLSLDESSGLGSLCIVCTMMWVGLENIIITFFLLSTYKQGCSTMGQGDFSIVTLCKVKSCTCGCSVLLHKWLKRVKIIPQVTSHIPHTHCICCYAPAYKWCLPFTKTILLLLELLLQ